MEATFLMDIDSSINMKSLPKRKENIPSLFSQIAIVSILLKLQKFKFVLRYQKTNAMRQHKEKVNGKALIVQNCIYPGILSLNDFVKDGRINEHLLTRSL